MNPSQQLVNAERLARTVFGTAIQRVTFYTHPSWRDGGWRGFRVHMPGEVIHWMTKDGKHQDTICCRKGRDIPEANVVEVVRR